MPCPAWNCHIALWSHQDDVLIGAFTNIDDHVVYYHRELLSVCVTLGSLKWSNCIIHWGLVIFVNTHRRWAIFCPIQILLSQEQLFIRPFENYTPIWKTGRIMPWQCPSVRPSAFSGLFFQHALRYQFETWYIHSVGGTTCWVWVASQLGHFDLVYSQK